MTWATAEQDVVTAIQTVVGAVTGVRDAPTTPPDGWPGGVTALCTPAIGSSEETTAGRMRDDETLHLLVATARVNVRTDWDALLPLGLAVPAALLVDQTLSGVILHDRQIRRSFGEFEWAGQQLMGWRFEIDVVRTDALSGG